MPGVLIVGSYCHDELELADGTRARALGGSSAYIGRILTGLNVGFTIVAKVGEDFSYTSEVVQPPIVAQNRLTTAFRHRYEQCDQGGASRHETLEQVCDPLSAAEVAAAAAGLRFAIGIACGVAFETGVDAAREMRKHCDWLVADAQSLLREASASGEVRLKRYENTAFSEVSGLFDVIKFSESEARCADLNALAGDHHLIITYGERGSRLLEKGTRRVVDCPALATREVDATGAGDSFLAGFCFGLLKGLKPEQALRVGNYCGALAVSQHGVPKLSADDFLDLRPFLVP